ncbi:MAG: extracellular solute-binding protein [Actinobacteria bacterium]|nr:extracellular solute-binding protein [Actinomycetota bacterium]
MCQAALLGALLLVGACASGASAEPQALRIYSTVTEATVNAVIEDFKAANPDVVVELFRAATGEVNARIASELREGGLQADVLWLTDPLSIQQYEADGLLRTWRPSEVNVIPGEYRTETFFGTRVLNMIIVHGNEVADPPADWNDLAEVEGGVALPDPAFAGSAFATLAYFATADGYGLDFYQQLAESGAVQVQAPADVITGVAEGVYAAGVTLDQAARAAVADGSPISMVWPASGAVAIYSPIAVVNSSTVGAAEAFVDHVLSLAGQEAIAATGWQPIRSDVAWNESGGSAIAVDWTAAFDRQEELLADYAAIFGG